MKNKLTLFIFLCFINIALFGQKTFEADSLYKEHSKKALSFYKSKDFSRCAFLYDSLFTLYGGKGTKGDRYNAACAFINWQQR